MTIEDRLKFIKECKSKGISETCRKHNVSRTLYYRWSKRYLTGGIEGLNRPIKRNPPVNKTNPEVEMAVLNLVKKYPNYGPKSLTYLLEELNYAISESAVYNIFKRHNITQKKDRRIYSKQRSYSEKHLIPPIDQLKSSQCWIFWVTPLGENLYLYNFFDIKSRIACSRIYREIKFCNFEDIFTAVALSVATTLNMSPEFICFAQNNRLKRDTVKMLQAQGRDIKVILPGESLDIDNITYKESYISGAIETLLPLLSKSTDIFHLKTTLQDYIRYYNLEKEFTIDGESFTPINYHTSLTGNKVILPIWAYINREY